MKHEGKVLNGSLHHRYMRSDANVVKHEAEENVVEVYKFHHTFGFWMFQYVDERPADYQIFD